VTKEKITEPIFWGNELPTKFDLSEMSRFVFAQVLFWQRSAKWRISHLNLFAYRCYEESRILVSDEFHLPENHRLQHVSGEPRSADLEITESFSHVRLNPITNAPFKPLTESV
jgi:hypothetical protein